MLDPKRAILIEGGNTLFRGHKFRACPVRGGSHEVEDCLFCRSFVPRGSASLEVAVCADAEMDPSGADKTGSNANAEIRVRRSMRGTRNFSCHVRLSSGGAAAVFVVTAAVHRLQIDRLQAYFDASPRLRICKIGRLIGCPLVGWSGRAPACADRRHDCVGDDGKAVYLLLGFIVGAWIGCIPLEADAPALGPLYHGLERHSASVPDAVA